MRVNGREFFKLSGSGNDFVFVDARDVPPGALERPEVVRSICARGTGVGADGVVFLLPSELGALRIRYLNADGSQADLCGNATLCSTRLAVELGAAPAEGFALETDAGVLAVRLRDGRPEIDLRPVTEVRSDAGIAPAAGERRVGFALAGVPHLAILCDDVRTVDVVGRGAPLRRHPSLRQGANVNFLSAAGPGRWQIRTFERGVEGETLACGTGAVASAVLLRAWGEHSGPTELVTRSGRTLVVGLREDSEGLHPTLAGEGRIVFRGRLGELDLPTATAPSSPQPAAAAGR